MPTKIKMKVTSLSHDPPMHMGGYMGPKPRIPNLPIFLSLFPSEERWPFGGIDASERLIERPVEKVRIKTESEGEKDAQIIRPMVGSSVGMNPPVPTTIMLTESEFDGLGRPTLGDEVTLTIERASRTDST